MCGGDKVGRGCGKINEGHELFCQDAKLCFSVISTSEASVKDKEGALLQIMKIPRLKPSMNDLPYEVVLWDTGSTNNYVRNDHARKMGFPSRRETMRVLTIGGNVKTINGIYRC